VKEGGGGLFIWKRGKRIPMKRGEGGYGEKETEEVLWN